MEKSFSLFADYIEYMEIMDDVSLGAAMRAVWCYVNGKEIPELDGVARMLYTTIRRDLDRKQEAKENGAKRGKEKREGGATPLPGPSDPTTTPLPGPPEGGGPTYTETVTKTNTRHNPPKSPQGEKFERFWACYPRKAGKGNARKIFAKLKPSEELLEKMLKAIELAKQSPQWQRDGGQYIPYPATWLNQERWEDSPGDTLPDRRKSYDIQDLEELAVFDLPEAL